MLHGFQDVRLCITVLHRENTGALRGIAGAKDLFVGMVSFPMEQVLDTGYAGWFRLLDERDGGGVVVPLRKVRVSHRVSSLHFTHSPQRTCATTIRRPFTPTLPHA